MRHLSLGLTIATFMLATACATPRTSSRPAVSDAERAATEAMFENFKALEGRWMQAPGGEGEQVATAGTPVKYELTAAGSAVVETVFEGQDHEMVTVYTVDDGRLVLTHYCAMQNQPFMVADPITSSDAVSFEAVSVGNASLDDPHMHWAEFHFVDANHLVAEWTIRKDGEPGFVGRMNLVRADQ